MIKSKHFCRSLLTFLFLYGANTFAQGVKISYLNPSQLNICSSDEFVVFLENTDPIDYQNIQIELDLPSGINYFPSSVFGATEFNILILSHPIFSISGIKSKQKLRIEFRIEANCLAFDQLEKGISFQNKIILSYNQTKDSLLTSPPYTLMTPFLIISEVVDQDIPLGTIGKRIIKITNSRLGSCDSFFFEDQHGPAQIKTQGRTVIIENNNLLKLFLGPKDFVNIGDHDSLFEENEMIIIEEEISSLDCLPSKFSSNFKVNWGCNGESCQENNETAIVAFISSDKRANLSFSENPLSPKCICQIDGATQSLMISNIGQKIAEDIELEFRTNINTPTNSGFIKDSITIIGNVEIDTIYFKESNTTCMGQNLFYSIIVKIKRLDLNQSVKIFFKFVSCESMPASGITDLSWYYSYRYSSQCVPNSLVELINRAVPFQFKSPGSVDIVSFIEGNEHNIVSNKIYNLIHYLNYPKNLTNENLYVYIELPCPFELADSIFLLNNKKPESFEIIRSKGLGIKLIYKAPFSIADTTIKMAIKIDCNSPCIDTNLVFTKVKFVSSCEVGQLISSSLSAEICTAAQISCPDSLGECGPKSGIKKYSVNFDCNPTEILKYEVPGYVRFTSEAYRSSFGDADINNDRLKDPSGNLDTSRIRKDHFITGDTVCNEYFGKVIVDKLNSSFDSLVFFLTTPVNFDNWSAELDLFDADKNTNYHFNNLQVEPYIEKTELVNCSEPTLIKSGIGDGFYVRLTPEILNGLNPGFPLDFRFEDSDSLHFLLCGRAISFVGFRIAKVNMLHRILLRDRQNKSERDFFCQKINHDLFMATSCIKLNSPVSKDTMCGNNFELPVMVVEGLLNLSNFFPYEYRSLYKIDSVLVTLTNGLQADSLYVRVSYVDSFGQKLVQESFLPFVKGNTWFIPIDVMKKLRFDESYKIEFIVFGSTQDCNLIKNLTSLNANVTLFISKDFDAKFHKDPIYTVLLNNWAFSKTFEIISNNANAYIDIVNQTIITNSKALDWKANLRALAASGSFRIKLSSVKNQINQFNIITKPSVNIVDLGNNTFSVGPVDASTNYAFDFTGNNDACDGDTIIIESSWFCGSQTPDQLNDCITNTFLIPVVPKQPELELQLEQLDKEVLLCDTLEEVMLYVYNADFGTAYEVFIDLFVPDNVIIEPSSLKYAYPSNAAYKALALPQPIAQNHYRWFLKDIDPLLLANGLLGIDQIPSNGLRIKFKAYTTCNSTVNGYFSYLTSGKNLCGEETNSRAINGLQIKIKGITSEPSYSLSTRLDPGTNCINTQSLSVEIIPKAITTDKDSIKIFLPNPLTYVAGSFIVISNIVLQNPSIKFVSGGSELSFYFKPGINPGSTISFKFDVTGFDLLPCSEINISSSIFNKQQTKCNADQMLCDVIVVNAQHNLTYIKSSSNLTIDSLVLLKDLNNVFTKAEYHISISDISLLTESKICLKLFLDLNNNGKLDGGDKFVKESCFPKSLFIKDGQYFLLDSILSDLIQSCAIIATTSNNCFCNQDTFLIFLKELQIVHIADTICYGDERIIGTQFDPLAEYKWTGSEVSCDTCSRNKIVLSDTLKYPINLNYVLTEHYPGSCDKKYLFDFYAVPKIEGKKYYFNACLSDVIEIDAGLRKNYYWAGPGIINTTSYKQTVNFDSTKLLMLHFTESTGCSATDTFCFIVNVDTSSITVTPQTVTIALGESARFEVFGGKSFQWKPSSTLDCDTCSIVHAHPTETTDYEVEVTDSFGCLHIFKVRVILNFPDCDSTVIYVPNAFSPNGDNKNDVFRVRSNNINILHLFVYSRWGEKVFESFDINVGWDGSFKGAQCGPDVFGYYLEAECFGGKRFIKKGNVSLLK
ncbi:MAG: gliding motility-associated C-terminal domain-containing protein [Saprospiraceae bacterium]